MRAGPLAGALALAVVVLAGCALVRRDHSLASRGLMVPVAGVYPGEVPDRFGERRGRRRHAALDIVAPRGTPVVSADDGVVVSVHRNRLGGRVVYAIYPHRRFVYYYAHLDAVRDGLRAGVALARGDVLGTVGTTGNAEGGAPHLHFQVTAYPADGRWWDGEPIDPRPHLVRPGSVR